MTDKIVIKGARENNLKNISVEIPRNKLVVFTGISGSGKSSLAFDTIYAEGQRRYVESLSAYARQFLGIMDKPDVDLIEGLSPAISIDQKSVSHNPRSTVGTVTEIYDYLRLLFARIGHPHCPSCGREISHQTVQEMVEKVLEMAKNKVYPERMRGGFRIMVLGPVVRDRKGEFSQLLKDLKKKGFSRVRIDGQIRGLDEEFILIKTNKHTVEVIVDRLVITKEILKTQSLSLKSRLTQSLETALRLADGTAIVSEILDASFEMPPAPKKFADHLYSERFACPQCNISLPEIEPRTFSFNSPHGACPKCTGLGSILEIDSELVINPALSINEGGILPWSRFLGHDTWFTRLLVAVAQTYNFSLDEGIAKIPSKVLNILLFGSKEETFFVSGRNRFGRRTSFEESFEGVIPHLMRRFKETDSDWVRREIEKYMRVTTCPECLGARLKKEALSITIFSKSIWEIAKMSIKEVSDWILGLSLFGREETIAKPILKELKTRLKFLIDVGLDYLTLDRPTQTLAGGEVQRIRLASQIGSGLTGVLYILDEPSVGLHQRDNHRLLETLIKLRDLGNTVIVVEHDKDTILSADWVLDFGPEAGEHGGKIVASGTPGQISKNPASLTGQYLSGKKKVLVQSQKNTPNPQPKTFHHLTILGAKEHNLKNIKIEIPLSKFVCVTGVSGSGKSTLVNDILYRALSAKFYRSREKPGVHGGILGVEHLDKVVLIDQSPIGRTPRSNPATYTGAFTYIRELFAKTREARIRGYKPGRFSFNVKGGRCEACEGEGQIKIEMQFLPDVYVTCEVCLGRRYNSEALEILYKDKNIAQVLDMTVSEALSFFETIPQIKHKLQTLADVGLGYIRLGQPAPTLSGGEAQRVKLSHELSKKATGKTLYLLDEPTTGLHFADIEKLLLVLRRLVDLGNTVVIIEHNMDVIKNTDWIIDLGPEGGDLGGEIVACGTPADVAQNKNSYTGQFLKKVLES